jgi:hypothetical protein
MRRVHATQAMTHCEHGYEPMFSIEGIEFLQSLGTSNSQEGVSCISLCTSIINNHKWQENIYYRR